MTSRDIAVDVLLVLAILGEIVCVVGLLAGRTAIDKLHYAGAASTLPPFLIAAAVVVKKEGTQPAINAIVIAILMLVLGSVVGHATARVARRRTVGQLAARDSEVRRL
jgi:multisubunit Na+/H+ antiporter MnhG subunit